MSRIEFLKNLIADAETELKYLELYEEEKQHVKEGKVSNERFWSMRSPSRQRIRDSLKMIRRVSLDIERGLER